MDAEGEVDDEAVVRGGGPKRWLGEVVVSAKASPSTGS